LFITVQNGVTAMLAGRLAEALEFFTTAQLHPLVPSLAFLSRDAYVKAALLHALFGDTRMARTTLDQASSIPHTSSWAEPLIDVAITMTEAVLPGRDADASLEELSALPLQHVGEIWPFYVTALTRTLRESGRIREVEDLLTRYERLPLPRQTGQGYPGSVLPLKRALLRAQALDDSGAE